MKFASLIPLRLPPPILRLPSAELTEVLGRLGHDICEEFEFDAAEFFSFAYVSRSLLVIMSVVHW